MLKAELCPNLGTILSDLDFQNYILPDLRYPAQLLTEASDLRET